jgi:hypothetical protein
MVAERACQVLGLGPRVGRCLGAPSVGGGGGGGGGSTTVRENHALFTAASRWPGPSAATARSLIIRLGVARGQVAATYIVAEGRRRLSLSTSMPHTSGLVLERLRSGRGNRRRAVAKPSPATRGPSSTSRMRRPTG